MKIPKDGIFGKFNRRDYRISFVFLGMGIMLTASSVGTLTNIGPWIAMFIGLVLFAVPSVNQYHEPALPTDPPE